MGRSKETFVRREPHLDARKIFVIAFEGSKGKAEDRYLIGLQSLANESKTPIHIKSIPNTDNKSAPSYILENLEKFKNTFNLDYEEEESFILIDWDNHKANIENHNIIEKCKEQEFHLLLCNPCFELWLLLHFIDVSTQEKQEKNRIYENKKEKYAPRYINECLTKACGSSNKSKLNFMNYKKHLHEAIENAKKLEEKDNHDMKKELTARAYIVVEKILSYCNNHSQKHLKKFNQQK